MMPPVDPTTPLAPGAPPPMADATAPSVNPMVLIPMTEEDQKKWKGDIDRANRRRQVFEPSWERNIQDYTPDPTNTAWGDEINPGIQFSRTEQKKALLFFESPSIICTPEDDTPPAALAAIAAHQAQLNKRLGRKGLDCERLMDKVMFSILVPAGMACTKLGVTRITKEVPVPHPTDPNQPNLGPDGQPITAPVPVYQKIFWEHFSEKKVLIPTNFRDTEFDKAPWLGVKFNIPTRLAIREYGLDPDFKGKKANATDQVFQQPGVKDDDDGDEDMTSGTELFYRAALYDDNVYHPDHMRQLVFMDGQDEPAVHRDSPYQTFQQGVYQPDDPMNLVGNPIHMFTIRDLVDSAYIPSDATVRRPLVNELAKFRTQLIQHRDAGTSVRLGKESVFTPEILAKAIRAEYGGILVVPDIMLENVNASPPMLEMAHPQLGRESFESQTTIERDLTQLDAISANQTGAQQETTHSATEIQTVQRNADVRMEKERNRLLSGFVQGVAKLDALMKRFETPQGQQPISGYTYDIKPDSGMHVDAAADRKFAIDRLNILLKEPHINVDYLLTESAPLLRLDASKLIVAPPPPHPQPPKISFIVKGEDLSPLAPQYPNMQQALQEAGMTLTPTPITPTLVQNAALAKPLKPAAGARMAPNGGSPPMADKVNQHTADLVGNAPNAGGMAVQ